MAWPLASGWGCCWVSLLHRPLWYFRSRQMKVSGKKDKMSGSLSSCGGGAGRMLCSLGETPSFGVQMASSGQGHGGQQLLPLVTRLSVFRKEPPEATIQALLFQLLRCQPGDKRAGEAPEVWVCPLRTWDRKQPPPTPICTVHMGNKGPEKPPTQNVSLPGATWTQH